MTRDELQDMMYYRRFLFNLESKPFGEPLKLYFYSEAIGDRWDRHKVAIPSYGCIVYPDTDEFEFYTLKSSNNDITLTSPKYDNVQDREHFISLATQFENSFMKQAAVERSEEEIMLTTEDLNFGDFGQETSLS